MKLKINPSPRRVRRYATSQSIKWTFRSAAFGPFLFPGFSYKAWMMGEIISGQEDVVNDGGGKGVRESLRKSQRFGSEIASVSHG